MNELINNNEKIQVSYEVFAGSREMLTFGGSSQIDSQHVPVDILDNIDEGMFDFLEDDTVDKAESLDYIIAASSGLITGLLDVFWVGEISLQRAESWGKEKSEEIVVKAAKLVGYKKDSLDGAIRFLEKKYPMASDGATPEFGGSLQHHLRDYAHHPTIAGLIFSILTQFTGYAYGTDTKGNFTLKNVSTHPGIGSDFTSKVFNGTVVWLFHLVSDMAGSSFTPGTGIGIPGPMISFLKEISTLPIVKELKVKYKGDSLELSKWISKLFNGDFFEGNVGRLKGRQRFDLRLEMGLVNEISRQILPVVINECLVRGFYSMSRLLREVENKEVQSLKDIARINPDNFLPRNNKVLTRMITISSGTFLVVDFVGAAVYAKGINKTFLLHINYLGIGRFMFAIKTDAKYITEDIKSAYEEFMKEHKWTYEENEFSRAGFEDLILNERQTKILYSLKVEMILYDISKTKSKKAITKKQSWLKKWKEVILTNVGSENASFFIEEENMIYHNISLEAIESADKNWFSLIVLELLQFKPYHLLGKESDIEFKDLTYKTNYLIDKLSISQNLMDTKYIKTMMRTINKFEGILINSTKKKVVGAAGVAMVTVATGGAALTFAPQIAILLAGSSVAGLSGAALTSASLALIGGGSLAAGGLGMAGGTAIIAGGGAILGSLGSGIASSAMLMASKDFSLRECTKLLTYCDLILDNKPETVRQIQESVSIKTSKMKRDIENLQNSQNIDSSDKASIKKVIKEASLSIKYLERSSLQLSIMVKKIS